ncbi:MAG: 50S ribosomal protein L4 [Patescibacteria group bacterium]
MNLIMYPSSGESVTLALPTEVDTVTVTPQLLHQAVTAEAANLRQPHAHTKTRATVRGGGKKPWKQKGTGRARASSNRSPLWAGGAVIFGPTPERNFHRRLSSKMRARAFQMAFATQLKEDHFRVIPDWLGLNGKTKQLLARLETLPKLGHRLLVVAPKLSTELILAGRNVPAIQLAEAASVRTTDLLLADTVILDQAALSVMVKRAFAVDLSTMLAKPQKSDEGSESTLAEDTEISGELTDAPREADQ